MKEEESLLTHGAGADGCPKAKVNYDDHCLAKLHLGMDPGRECQT